MRQFLVVVIVLVGLSACSDQLHEPGVYKGKSDSLLKKQTTAEQQERLTQRLLDVQTDR